MATEQLDDTTIGNPVYVGIGGHVLAIAGSSGDEIWRTRLAGTSNFVTVSVIDGQLIAATAGELYRLDPATGEIIWHNKLKGLGIGFVTLSGFNVPPAAAATEEAASSAAATAVLTAG